MRHDRAVIRAELEKLKTDGIIRPADVVKAASVKSSPLHDWFTWDDSEAAQQHRLLEARKLLQVYVVMEESESHAIRALVSLTTDRVNGGGYRTVADVMSDETLREQMLRDALTQLRNMQQKYRSLQALAGVWEEVDKVESKSAGTRKQPTRKVKAGKRLAA